LTTQFVAHKLSWFSTDHVGVLLPKIKKIPKNTNGRLAIPAPAGLLVGLFMDCCGALAASYGFVAVRCAVWYCRP